MDIDFGWLIWSKPFKASKKHTSIDNKKPVQLLPVNVKKTIRNRIIFKNIVAYSMAPSPK